MRIITGTARGINIETLDGLETRPTAERAKEALFSMIQFEIEGRNVLDLFAGSGQLGLEAISRGAQGATFVDINPDAVAIIKLNAQKAKLYPKCRILGSDYKQFLNGNAGREKFDIVFLDPPYPINAVQDAINMLASGNMINENGIIVCESDRPEPFETDGFNVRRHSKYGKIYITLLEKVSAQ